MTETQLSPMTNQNTKKVSDDEEWLTPRQFMQRLHPQPSYSSVIRWCNMGLVKTANASLLGTRFKIPASEVPIIESRMRGRI